MWHEARKQERKIRGMLVDYRKRAERRRDFYEKIKADPTQFLQIHGRQCKIHLDPAVAAAADSPAAMMPWQGQSDNLIDRFDVRAHLDFIPVIKKQEEDELSHEERQLNYERYRIIAQNSFLAISEEKFLKQLHLEEQFGYTEEPKKKKAGGAAIGYNYEDGTGSSQVAVQESSDENSDSDLDVDLSINVSKIDSLQAHEMNRHGRNFGMSSNDFYSFLTNDLEEAENYRLAKEEEHEKALFSGRKSRRERRAHREKRLANRVISPPSYAARTSPTYPTFHDSNSASRSPSPENTGKITYITSFGDDEEATSTSKMTYADKLKYGTKIKKLRESAIESRTIFFDKQISPTRDKDRSYRKRRRSVSVDSNNTRSKNKYISSSYGRYKRSRSRERRTIIWRSSSSESSRSSKSRSRSKIKSLSRSRSRSVSNSKSRSRSSSTSSTTSTSTTRSRSRSVSKKIELPPKTPLPRYYGRKRSDQSSSDLADSSEDEKVLNKPVSIPVTAEKNTSSGNSGTSTKKTALTVTLQERLKRKRQALLNKQFKADKIAEQIKSEREKQEQQNREDELREMAIKLRRKQRERRHAYESNTSSSSDHDSKTRSPLPSAESHRSRSRSPRSNRDYKSRESRRQYRSSRERSRDRDRERISKIRYDDKRRDDDRDRSYRRRDDSRKDREFREEYRERDREASGKSLVDY